MYVINLRKSSKTIKVSHKSSAIKIAKITRPITIKKVGSKGERGAGLPVGGDEGQYLTKASDANYDYEWTTVSVTDKTYEQTFNVSSLVTVTHGLQKFPSVSVIDSSGGLVEGSVTYLDNNQLTVSFSAPFSGKVVCN